MNNRTRRKHKAQKRALVVGHEHRPFFDATPGGTKSLAKLEGAVGTEAARITDQEACRSEQQAATDRCEHVRRTLHDGLRHVSTVSTLVPDEGAPTFATSRPANDEQLIARVEAVLAGASAHAEPFVNAGVQPALLDTLARELEAFRQGKDAITLAGQHFTEATERLNQALDEGDKAIAVLEGILATSPDAPVGALIALQQAKLIGPRAIDEATAESGPAPAPAPAVLPVPEKAA